MTLHQDTNDAIYSSIQALTKKAIDMQYARHGDIWTKYNEVGYSKSLRDSGFHFTYLAEAVAVDNPILFIDYVSWMKVFFVSNNFPINTVTDTLEFMKPALDEELNPDQANLVKSFIDKALKEYPEMPESLPSFIEQGQPYYNLAQKYLRALLDGRRHTASQVILDEVDRGMSVKDIYLHVFQTTQKEIGRLWQIGRISVAQEHFCTATTQMIISQLYPQIFSGKKIGLNLVATTVGGELHEMGMRMVADFFELEGWDTYFLGANTPAESVLYAIEMRKADIVAISATIPAHISKVRDLLDYIKSKSQQPVKIMVGGYPFNVSKGLWQIIGADSYAENAEEAISVARTLV